jgi:N-acetylglucosaminyldiphosphoundecaprenol N-acetyl-beta-D-mannosaminyltransferase
MTRVSVLDVPVDIVTRREFAALMERHIALPGTSVVQPLNVDTLNKTRTDRWLRDFIGRADAVYADGEGIVLGARLLGDWLPERLTAADLIWDLAEAWQRGEHSIYLLGGPPGLAEKAGEALNARFPGFRVAGTWRGHLDAAGDREALADIAAKKPDVLAVGFGTPVQERWIAQYWDELQGVPLIWPVGALATYVAGAVPRAPAWMRDHGLEWAFRLYLEPRRMFRRYVVGNPLFLARVLGARAKSAVRSRRPF